MKRLRAVLCLLLVASSGLTPRARAEEGKDEPFQILSIPFPFYNESFGFAAGYVYGRSGWPEPQSRVLGTAMAGSRARQCCCFAGQDLHTPWFDRLFIDPFASVGYFGEIESYANGSPGFPNQQAGSR